MCGAGSLETCRDVQVESQLRLPEACRGCERVRWCRDYLTPALGEAGAGGCCGWTSKVATRRGGKGPGRPEVLAHVKVLVSFTRFLSQTTIWTIFTRRHLYHEKIVVIFFKINICIYYPWRSGQWLHCRLSWRVHCNRLLSSNSFIRQVPH